MGKGGPRFPRAKREGDIFDHSSETPAEEQKGDLPYARTELSDKDVGAIPEPIYDDALKPPSKLKSDLSGEVVMPEEVISLADEDAVERLEKLQDELPRTEIMDPSAHDVIPNDAEVTEEDERELERTFAAYDSAEKARVRQEFEDSPEEWREGVLDAHLFELDQLENAGYEEKIIEGLIERFALEYAQRLKTLDKGASLKDDEDFSAETYAKELLSAYNDPERIRHRTPSSASETREIELPEDDHTKVDDEPSL